MERFEKLILKEGFKMRKISKIIIILVIFLMMLPLSIRSQQSTTITREQKLQETLADITILFNDSRKVNENMSKVIDNLIEDLKKIKNPPQELLNIFEKYNIPYEKKEKK